MLDRFSDGREADYLDIDGNQAPAVPGTATPRYADGDSGNAISTGADAAASSALARPVSRTG